jgi:two-component system sensor histidine kinase KdpD
MCITFFVVAFIIGFLTKLIRDREEKLAEALRLKESEKLHQTILNSISHEMRTPLTAILGSAWALSDENMARDLSYVKTAAQNLRDAGERLNRVIENLLDMSRLNSGALSLKLEWHDLHDLIGVTLNKLSRVLTKHYVGTELPEHLPLIEMDFRLMEHALSNIILNAATYTPENSEINITVIKEENSIKIVISDNGPGLPESALPKIFDKFFRVPGSPAGGTGLGLSIVKNIVELHGGTISVFNQQPHGAVFSIEIPVKKQPYFPNEDRHG